MDFAGGQRRIDEPAASLARPHLGVERVEPPATGDLVAERGDLCGEGGAGSQVFALLGVGRQVVELVGVGGEWMNLNAPRRIITIGAIAPSARYSPIASS